uniref:Uncharacterized protein n=1 Tax=Sphaerodactylus townsendi TaxID=933632 RepID=A0ACB8E5R8_9SAUR
MRQTFAKSAAEATRAALARSNQSLSGSHLADQEMGNFSPLGGCLADQGQGNQHLEDFCSEGPGLVERGQSNRTEDWSTGREEPGDRATDQASPGSHVADDGLTLQPEDGATVLEKSGVTVLRKKGARKRHGGAVQQSGAGRLLTHEYGHGRASDDQARSAPSQGRDRPLSRHNGGESGVAEFFTCRLCEPPNKDGPECIHWCTASTDCSSLVSQSLLCSA